MSQDCMKRSWEMVPNNQPPRVQLTKFNPLPPGDQFPSDPQLVLSMCNLDTGNGTTSSTSSSSSTSSPGGLGMTDAVNTQQDNIKSLSANDLLRQDDEAIRKRKWPWSPVKSPKGTMLEINLTDTNSMKPNLNALQRGQHQTTQEPFQVVWSRLSFEVQQSTYARVVGETLSKLRSFWQKPCQDELKKPIQDKTRVIFENLNGYIKSGEISAILGPSGSGKTSLLNAICGRVDNYRGSVQLLGGGKRRMRLSIIPQKDYLIENLTVRENLLYSSKILNADPEFDHEGNIMRVVKMLNLTNCLNSNAANISGGEYKRVSIAQELLRQPDILILDEPTSGLDSLNCKNLIKSLVQLIEASQSGAINPIAIVMTIHQPDIETFQMFHHVYCIARRGQVVFDGHPSEVLNVVKTYAGLPDDFLPSGSINPANLLIELASGDLFGEEPIYKLACQQRCQFEFNQAFQRSPSLLSASQQDNKGYQLSPNASPKNLSNSSSRTTTVVSHHPQNYLGESYLVRDKRLTAKSEISGKFWYHTGLLSKRAFTSTIRDPLMTILSLLFHLSIPFVMWTVYPRETGSVKACPVIHRQMEVVSMASNKTITRMEQMQEDFSLALECSTMFFLSTYSFSMCSLSIAALAFPLNMHILLKEVRNGWYSLPSYVLAKTLANIPFEVLYPTISIMMIYVMLGMPSSDMEWRLWALALVMGLISMISHTLGLIFGALCMDSVQTAIFLASATTLPLTLLSGFTARIKHMPEVLQKLSWLSLYRYSTDAINIIRFGFGICPCDSSTDDYLRNNRPQFTDVPQNMRPLFSYYLSNYISSGGDGGSNGTVSSDNTTIVTNITTTMQDSVKQQLVPGVNYDMILDDDARIQIMKRIEQNEIDLFGQLAQLMSRSFTYGMEVENCDSFRSQLLISAGTPKDQFLPMLFAGMVCLLVGVKITLFIIVKMKIGSRV